MDSEKSIKINIDVVVQQAKAALDDLSATTQKATATISNMGGAQTTTALNNLAASSQKATGVIAGVEQEAQKGVTGMETFFNSVTSRVLKTFAVWEVGMNAIHATTAFFTDSVSAAAASSETWARIQNNVSGAGLSYDSLSASLQKYAQQQVALGFTQDQVGLSVSRLLLITHDYSQAINLNNLAMDLARNKNISLEDATHAIALVTQGNVRALKDYGIELGATATVADVLTEAQQKVGGSAAAVASSAQGPLNMMKAQWDEIQITVGQHLQPVMTQLFTTFENNLPQIEALLIGVANAADFVAKGLGYVITPVVGLGYAIGNLMNAIQGLPLVSQDTAHAMDNVTAAASKQAASFAGLNDISKKQQQEAAAAAKQQAAAEAAANDAITNRATAINKLKTEMQALTDEYDKISNKEKAFAFDNDADFSRFAALLADTTTKQSVWFAAVSQGFSALDSAIKSTNSNIDTLQKKLADTSTQFADFLKSTNATGGDDFAKIVHDAETALPDLRQKLLDANETLAKAQQQLSTAQTGGDDAASVKAVADAKNQLADAEYKLAQAQAQGQPPQTVDQQAVAAAKEQLNAAQQALTNLQNAQKDSSTISQDQGSITAAQKAVDDLKKQIDDKNSILTSSKKQEYTNNADFMSQLQFLRTQDGKNELDQAYAVMQQKITAKAKETMDQQTEIRAQIDAQQGQVAKYTTQQDEMTAKYKEAVDARNAIAQKEIDHLVAMGSTANTAATAYNNLASAISNVVVKQTQLVNLPTTIQQPLPIPPANALQSGAQIGQPFGNSTPQSASIPTFRPAPIISPYFQAAPTTLPGFFSGFRAGGGPVESDHSYMVGEKGPEMFTPRQSGTITPTAAPVPSNIVLNFNFHDAVVGDAGVKQIITQAVGELNRQATLRGFAGK